MEDWNCETIFYGHYRSVVNHCDIIGLQSYRIRWKKRKIAYGLLCHSKSFKKIMEVGTNRKPVRDFLLVINSNWHPISYRFGVIAAYCSNFGHCVYEPPFGSLGTTYDVHLWLIGKRVVDLLLVLIDLFCSVLRLKRYERISVQNRRFRYTRAGWPNILCRRGRPYQPFFFSEK